MQRQAKKTMGKKEKHARKAHWWDHRTTHQRNNAQTSVFKECKDKAKKTMGKKEKHINEVHLYLKQGYAMLLQWADPAKT